MRFRPGDHEAARRTIAELTDRYDAWYRSRHPDVEMVDVGDLGLLLDWKIGYGNGRFDEWTIDQLEEFLLEWCPRKVTVSAAQAALMPAGIAEAFAFLADQGLLSARSVRGEHLATHALSLTSEFTAEMANPANFGMAKSIFAGADLPPGESLTQEWLDALVADVNARPFEERPALRDEALEVDDPDAPIIGPVRLPDDGAVRASAASAPVLAGFASLAEYFRAPGRPLTAKGNIKLADARALSEILGTEDVEEKVGDTTFARRSTANMPHFDHWQWWAREVGALRVRNGRMVGVEAWLKRRAQDPAGQARKAFDVLVAFGPLASYVTYGRRPIMGLVDMMTSPLLGMLLAATEPVEFSILVDAVEDVRAATGQRGTFDNPEYDRRDAARVVDMLLTLLERAGVVEQHEITREQSHLAVHRTGGTITLTPFGVVTAVDHVRESGLDVITVGDPTVMTAMDVARLAVLGPEEWPAILTEWVTHQADRQVALRSLLDVLDAAGAVLVAMLFPVPEEVEADLAAVMHQVLETHRPDDVLGAVAVTWLVDHGRLDPEGLPHDALLTSGLTTLALLAKDNPEAVPSAMGTDRPRQDHLALVREAARRMPPNVEALLDAIARHHADAAVATAARKELMRARSRQARRPRKRR